MALLTAQGLIDDGSDDLVVSGDLRVTTITGIASTLLGSGSSGSAGEAGHGSFAVGSFVPIPGPGFFLVPVTGALAQAGQAGASGFTGSLPNPASFPGGEIMITSTTFFPFLLTGSMCMFSGSAGGPAGIGAVASFSSINGSKLAVQSGSFACVGLKSNSVRWMIMYGSGSMFLTV